ncbi:MAG: hypothetical protein PQJ44_06955 [Sphaerochaetaceae bacterium]|nr:hypothetical protein [Sphaerochaetaceae bacterium]
MGNIYSSLDTNANSEVIASENIADNVIVRADGGAKGIQGSGVTLDDSDNMSGVSAFDCTSATIDPGASGDSFVQFDINTTGEFRVGVDDDGDAFKISQGSALGTNDTFIMSAAGERTMALQPAFLAYLGTTDSNVTGDATVFTLGSGNALTEVFDHILASKFKEDMERRVSYVLDHKFKQCFKRLRQEWEPKLKARGVLSIPLDEEAFCEMVFAQDDYKDREARDSEE